jgi:hypothetical protein
MLGELVTLLKRLCVNNSYAHRYLYQSKDLKERFHNVQRLWGSNNVEVFTAFIGVFLVLLVLFMKQ